VSPLDAPAAPPLAPPVAVPPPPVAVPPPAVADVPPRPLAPAPPAVPAEAVSAVPAAPTVPELEEDFALLPQPVRHNVVNITIAQRSIKRGIGSCSRFVRTGISNWASLYANQCLRVGATITHSPRNANMARAGALKNGGLARLTRRDHSARIPTPTGANRRTRLKPNVLLAGRWVCESRRQPPTRSRLARASSGFLSTSARSSPMIVDPTL